MIYKLSDAENGVLNPLGSEVSLPVAAYPLFQGEKPIERTAFVFLDEANARHHLHELWLREHECWAIIDGQQHHLDEAYHPSPD